MDDATTAGAGPHDEVARDEELVALVETREREEAERWVAMAGFGLAAIALSTMSWWWVAEAPTALFGGTSPPPLVWFGLVVAGVATVAVVVGPACRPPAAPAAIVGGSVLVAAGGVIGALHADPGSGPWLALCGAIVTGTSGLAGLIHAGPGRASSPAQVASSWTSLLSRVKQLGPAWGIGDRLALVSLTIMLFAVVLPWGPGPYDSPLVLHQARTPGLLMLTVVVATFLVTASVVWRGAIGSPGGGTALINGPVVLAFWLAVAGGVAIPGSLLVRAPVDSPPFPVPGRLAAVVGGAGLVVASAIRAWRAGTLARVGARQLSEPPANHEKHARQSVGKMLKRTAATRQWWPGSATVLVAVGAVGLTAPWWRSSFGFHGPYIWGWAGDRTTGIDAGESTGMFRSGIELLGADACWLVAAAAGLAAVAAVVLGVRRASLVTAGAAAALTAVAFVGLATEQTGATIAPWLVAAVGAIAAGIAGFTWWSGVSRPWRYVVVPVAAGTLVAGLVVATPAAPSALGTDGPFRVLVGGDRLEGHDPLTPIGASVAEVGADRAFWFQDEPAFLGLPGNEVAMWVVSDGRVEVRDFASGSVDEYGDEPEVESHVGDTVLIHRWLDGADRSLPALWKIGQSPRLLPEGTSKASVGPDGRVWMVPDEAHFGAPLHVATVEELSTPSAEASTIERWPAVSLLDADWFGATDVGSLRAGEDGALVLMSAGNQLTLVFVRTDGSARTVLGGALDRRCGVNREATASSLAAGTVGPVDVEYGSSLDDVPRLPLRTAVPAPDGGAWLVLPAARPTGERVHDLGRVDPDGTVRRVDHALPPIRWVAPSPDGESMLVVDWSGRVLELSDADSRTVPLPPPPPGCHSKPVL
jgi:hypothetical protein